MAYGKMLPKGNVRVEYLQTKWPKSVIIKNYMYVYTVYIHVYTEICVKNKIYTLQALQNTVIQNNILSHNWQHFNLQKFYFNVNGLLQTCVGFFREGANVFPPLALVSPRGGCAQSKFHA